MTTRNEQTSGFQTADFSKSEDPSLLSSFPVEVIAGAGGATGMAASAGSPTVGPGRSLVNSTPTQKLARGIIVLIAPAGASFSAGGHGCSGLRFCLFTEIGTIIQEKRPVHWTWSGHGPWARVNHGSRATRAAGDRDLHSVSAVGPIAPLGGQKPPGGGKGRNRLPGPLP